MKLRSIITIALASVVIFSSCLKKTDRLGYLNDKGSIISEIATHNEGDPFVISVEPLPAVETLDLMKLAFHNAKNLPSGDIKIKVELDPQQITDYNNDPANTTALEALPFTSFTLSDPTLEVTIPKGTYGDHTITMTLNKAGLSLVKTYALAFKIVSVSEGVISDIAGKFMVIIGVKNKYDGIYKAKGYGNLGTTNTTAPFLFSVDCDWLLNIITAGPNTVYMDAQPLYRGGSIIYFGNVFPKFAFDLTTNKVTGMATDAPGNGISFQFPVDGGTYDSRYDPATKTIFVRFGLNNNPAWRIVDTLTYCGPR